MRGSNFLLRPLSFDRQNAEKISLFVSLSPFSLSLSYLFSFLPVFASLPFSFFFFFFSFLCSLSYPPKVHPFVCSHLIFSFFSFFFFILSFHFSLFDPHPLNFPFFFPFFHFLYSISHLDCINRMVQKWGKLLTPQIPEVIFLLFFFVNSAHVQCS